MPIDLDDPERTFRQLKQVRDTGEANMLDINNVQRVAHGRGLHHLVTVLQKLNHFEAMELVTEDFSKWLEENEPSS